MITVQNARSLRLRGGVLLVVLLLAAGLAACGDESPVSTYVYPPFLALDLQAVSPQGGLVAAGYTDTVYVAVGDTARFVLRYRWTNSGLVGYGPPAGSRAPVLGKTLIITSADTTGTVVWSRGTWRDTVVVEGPWAQRNLEVPALTPGVRFFQVNVGPAEGDSMGVGQNLRATNVVARAPAPDPTRK